MTDQIKPDNTLDARGLVCPMPLLKTKKTIDKMEAGQILEILSTDGGTRNDLPAFARSSGHEYLGNRDDDGFARFYIRVK